MIRWRCTALVVFSLIALTALIAGAQAQCVVPEVQAAKDMLKAKTASVAKPPRPLASARGQDVQAPRGQDVQAPRGQDIQAPRGQDVQAPRGQDVQAPRSPASSKARSTTLSSARRLVNEADAACKQQDNARAAANARAAMELLKYLP